MTDQTGPDKNRTIMKETETGAVVRLDLEHLANYENSIAVETNEIKAGWFGKLYETICNAPVVVVAGSAAMAGNTAEAFSTAAGLVLVVPIYGAMAFATWTHAKNRSILRQSKAEYIRTGDEGCIDLVSDLLAEDIAEKDVPLIRGEKRDEYRQKFKRHAGNANVTSAEHARKLGKALTALRPKHVPKAAVSVLSGSAMIAKTMAHDVVGLATKMPKDVLKGTYILNRNVHEVAGKALSSRWVSISGSAFDFSMAAKMKAESISASYVDRFRNAREDLKPEEQVDKSKTDDEAEEIIGHVESAEEATRRVDKDHLDRTIRNIEANNKQQRNIIRANVVGLAFESMFILKYVKEVGYQFGKMKDSIATNLSDIQMAGQEDALALAQATWNSSGEIGSTAGLGFVVVMATAAGHHMLKTIVKADEEMHDKVSQWAETVQERREFEKKVERIERQLTLIFDPEYTDEAGIREAHEKIERITGGITPRSLPEELRQEVAKAQRMMDRDSSTAAEFGIPDIPEDQHKSEAREPNPH